MCFFNIYLLFLLRPPRFCPFFRRLPFLPFSTRFMPLMSLRIRRSTNLTFGFPPLAPAATVDFPPLRTTT